MDFQQVYIWKRDSFGRINNQTSYLSHPIVYTSSYWQSEHVLGRQLQTVKHLIFKLFVPSETTSNRIHWKQQQSRISIWKSVYFAVIYWWGIHVNCCPFIINVCCYYCLWFSSAVWMYGRLLKLAHTHWYFWKVLKIADTVALKPIEQSPRKCINQRYQRESVFLCFNKPDTT